MKDIREHVKGPSLGVAIDRCGTCGGYWDAAHETIEAQARYIDSLEAELKELRASHGDRPLMCQGISIKDGGCAHKPLYRVEMDDGALLALCERHKVQAARAHIIRRYESLRWPSHIAESADAEASR